MYLGIMDQAKRESLGKMVLLFYTFMSIFAGYYSAKIYKMYNVRLNKASFQLIVFREQVGSNVL